MTDTFDITCRFDGNDLVVTSPYNLKNSTGVTKELRLLRAGGIIFGSLFYYMGQKTKLALVIKTNDLPAK